MSHYKGQYRLRTEIDKYSNTFPREYTGQFAENDIYIDCEKGVHIYHYGNRTLEAVIPSLQSGRGIVRLIYRDLINKSNTETTVSEYDVNRKEKVVHIVKENISIIDKKLFNKELNNNDIIFHIEETDLELLFRFNAKHMKDLEPYLKPKTSGADISPFSSRNLPKSSYSIPDEDLITYKEIIADLPQNQLITLVHTTKSFIQSLATKKNTYEDIKADMALKCLKGKEYVHSISKWKEYMDYLKIELKEILDEQR